MGGEERAEWLTGVVGLLGPLAYPSNHPHERNLMTVIVNREALMHDRMDRFRARLNIAGFTNPIPGQYTHPNGNIRVRFNYTRGEWRITLRENGVNIVYSVPTRADVSTELLAMFERITR